jgi:uncharacterized membrane protein YkoI
MKIKRLMGMGTIALLAIGTMGFVSMRVYAQVVDPPAPRTQASQVVGNGQVVGADTGQDQEQVDVQNGPDIPAESGKESSEIVSQEGQDAVPSGTPSISADAAVKIAQTHLNSAAAGKATLDDENGKLVYSVDLNGSDVKVDAVTGAVLGVDQSSEGQTDGGN